MTNLLGFLPFLLLPLVGLVIWRFDFVRAMALHARLALSLATGALLAALLMAALSIAGIEWSRTAIFPPLLILVAFGIWSARTRTSTSADAADAQRFTAARIGIAAFGLLAVYGCVTARLSGGDLHFTWGPKAIRWFRAGGIDASVLHTWPQILVDYPPLHTLLLALSNTFSHQFSWWAPIFATPLFFFATLAVIHAWSGDDAGTLLLAGTMTYAFTLAYPAGCAEPALLLFEAIAIGALTFVEHPRAQTLLVALGLAGAMMTKLEGTTFAIAVLLTMVVLQRQFRRAALVILPGALLFGAWMVFIIHNDLLTMYGGARMPLYWSSLPVTLKTIFRVLASQLYGLPYALPLLLIAFGNIRRALVPVAIAVLTTGAAVYFYVHMKDPVWWIESSAPRVLLTPLLALLIGAIAARPCARVARHGVVPEGEETEGGGGPSGRHPRGTLGQV